MRRQSGSGDGTFEGLRDVSIPRVAMALTIQTQLVAMARSHTFPLPQGSICLFVVNTDLAQSGAAPSTPGN